MPTHANFSIIALASGAIRRASSGPPEIETLMPRPRILLAEDHGAVADQLRRLLEVECDVVATVHDGLSLIAAYEALSPCVVVSDIAMPRLNGLTAAKAIRTSHPDARIVVVTISDDPAVVRSARAAGVLGYVLKAEAHDELLRAVRAARMGCEHLSPSAQLSNR